MLAEVDISSDPQRCERLLRTDHVLHQAIDLHPLLSHLQPQQNHAVSNLLWYRIQLHILHHLPLHLLLLLSQHQQKGPTCSHEVKVISVATSAINVVSDFYILLIPLAAISNLQLPKKRKLGLFAIFFTGFL